MERGRAREGGIVADDEGRACARVSQVLTKPVPRAMLKAVLDKYLEAGVAAGAARLLPSPPTSTPAAAAAARSPLSRHIAESRPLLADTPTSAVRSLPPPDVSSDLGT